jgi:siderophore synthetase component
VTTAVQPQSSSQPRSTQADAAERLAVESLLRCWIRERALPRPAAADLVLELGETTVTVPVRYWSATGWHRFGPARTDQGPATPGELARLMGLAGGASPADAASLAERATESAERVAVHLADRAAKPAPPDPETSGVLTTPFLAAEQALLAGHPLHPTPKSRDGLAEPAYSPELRGGFQLDWFSVDESLIAEDSELGPTAHDLCTFLSGTLPDDGVLVPAHPWQAADLLRRPAVRKLVEDGKLRHRGVSGPRWFATSSLRTVYRPDSPVMLKLSLGLNITNSKRENLRKELLRGVEAHRLFAGTAGSKLLAAHPHFRMLTDAAYLAVDGAPGLDVSIRHSPFRPTDYVYCVAALTDLGRGAIGPDGAAHELAAHIKGLAEASGRPVREIAADWFARYVSRLIVPMLWMDAELGVTLEGHQQNTLIQLDEQGFPGAGWYRDNQGFYYRESRIEELAAQLGEPELGRASDTVVPDDVVTERLLYYVGINNLFGVVGALGCAGLAEERDLLRVARDELSVLRGHGPTDLLLEAATLRCKANLLTRAAGLDELVGDLATQSVYVEIPNPCATERPR